MTIDNTGHDQLVLPIDEIDVLALWRTRPLTEIYMHEIARLSGVLIAYVRSKNGPAGGEDVLLRAQAREAEAWLQLAEFLNPEIRVGFSRKDLDADDRHASCLLVALIHGSKWAAALLTLRLAQTETSGVDPEVRLAAFAQIARRYDLNGAQPSATIRALGVARAIEEARKAEADAVSPAPSADPAEAGAALHPALSVQILLGTPAAPNDRELKSLMASLGSLDRRIPLVPAPAVEHLIAMLRQEFPWAGSIIDEIAAGLALDRRLGRQTFRLTPTIIIGPAGAGKTTFARRLAGLANVPTATLLVGGASDSRTLSGTARGWSSAALSFPLDTIRRMKIANPLIIVEEIDKAGGSDRSGRVTDVLLGMLDPVLSARWLDECVGVEIDISNVSWILTGNRLDRIPPALRSRCCIISFPSPRPEDFDVLLTGISRAIADEYGIALNELPELGQRVIKRLRYAFAVGHLQARQLAALVRRLMSQEALAEALETRH